MGKSIIFLYSYHSMNTSKIGNVIAKKINAKVIYLKNNAEIVELDEYDLIGFGSGIASGKHYVQILKYAEELKNIQNKKVFMFSTCGTYNQRRLVNNHKALRNILQSKGFEIIGEFSCKGFSYYNFKLFKTKKRFEMNKGRPNEEDIKNAEIFAEKLLEKI